MAASKHPPFPQHPGSGKPHVPQPGQFIGSPAPSNPVAESQAGVPAQGAVVRHISVPAPSRTPDYVDPVLFEAGVFKDRADYNATVKSVIARIKSGQVQPREPELDDELEAPVK